MSLHFYSCHFVGPLGLLYPLAVTRTCVWLHFVARLAMTSSILARRDGFLLIYTHSQSYTQDWLLPHPAHSSHQTVDLHLKSQRVMIIPFSIEKLLFETSWIWSKDSTPEPQKARLSGTNTLGIKSIILKCQRDICGTALWWISVELTVPHVLLLSSKLIHNSGFSGQRCWVIVSVVWLVKIRDLHR